MKILFITHNTSRSGAPMVLLYFMQWLKENNSIHEMDCISLGEGSLDDEFKTVSNNFYQLKLKESGSLLTRIGGKITKTSPQRIHEKKVLKKLITSNYDIVYANSVVSLGWGVLVKKYFPNTKLLVHLHELEVVIKNNCPQFDSLKQNVDFWICASQLVKSNIVDTHQISETKTQVVYEFSKLPKVLPLPKKHELNRSFVVGGSGGVNRRKGYDLFIMVAKEVKGLRPDLDILFEWVGKFPNWKIENEVLGDIAKAGLQNQVVFKGEETNPFESYGNFDLFLLTSREDPFPLVCIEVGSLGKPIICFEGVTGTEEILSKGGGIMVPFLSISSMAQKVIEYASNKDLLYSDGVKAQESFKQFILENQAPKVLKVLKDLVHES